MELKRHIHSFRFQTDLANKGRVKYGAGKSIWQTISTYTYDMDASATADLAGTHCRQAGRWIKHFVQYLVVTCSTFCV